MAELKLVINDPKSGKSYQKVLPENTLSGRKVTDTLKGEEIELPGYELEITGGTDNSGIPIRSDLEGVGKRKILLSKGPCVKLKRKGLRKRKTVVANTINEAIAQVNLKITKAGSTKLEDALGIKKEETPAEAPAAA